MKGLERFLPGTGSHAVAVHLHDVAVHARRDLRRAPDHQKLLLRNLAFWVDAAHGPDRDTLDRVGADVAVAQFSHLEAPSSVTGFQATRAARFYHGLIQAGWLETTPGPGHRRLYRARVGTPFGIDVARSTR